MEIRKRNDGKSEDERREFVPGAKYDDWQPSALPPRDADGGFAAAAAAVEQPEPIPAATPEQFICLRGPCRHYWTLETFVDAGNPKGTFAELGLRVPRQRHHICLVHPGLETDLTEDVCFSCSRWDPVPREELIQLEGRRRAYYDEHPEHDPLKTENVNVASGTAESEG